MDLMQLFTTFQFVGLSVPIIVNDIDKLIFQVYLFFVCVNELPLCFWGLPDGSHLVVNPPRSHFRNMSTCILDGQCSYKESCAA